MVNYKDKKVLVVGLGRSGLAAAKFLAREGAKLSITDNRPESELKNEINTLNCGTAAPRHRGTIKYNLGSNPPQIFAEQDLIVLSPGVPLDIEGIKLAKEKGVPIVCELELGLNKLTGKLIGITGTNGKSTTTELVGEMLKKTGEKVWVGGNIGRPLIDGIDEASSANYVVLELSSYQLELTPSLKPYVSVWLNVTPDHLDRYDSFDHYVKAKAMISSNQTADDWVVFNCDDPIVAREVESFKSTKVPFSVSRELKNGGWYEGLNFRLQVPQCHGATVPDFSLDTSVAKIRGVHNRENIAAAAIVAAICGVDANNIEQALREFEGLPHRLQFVRKLNGVSYFNDSKGTNVGAVVRSIESFDSPVVLIAGGQDKNTGYKELRGVVKNRVKMIVAIGEAAGKINSELKDVTNILICKSMEDAVKMAQKNSATGDIILLSPACASFDMYTDYTERGKDFTRCVSNL